MPVIHLQLNIPMSQCQRYYRGQARFVLATAENGQVVQFPVSVLRQHMRHDGVRGRFALHFDGQNRLLAFRRV